MSDIILSIVLPAFNERDQLASTVHRIRECVAELEVAYEIIVVDDGSTDGSWHVLAELATNIPQLCGISFSRNFGKEAALLAGLQSSRGAGVVVMDCDLQHPPELISQMYRKWKEEGYDVVNAVKQVRQREGLTHALGARLFYRLFDGLTSASLANSSDFKLLDRRVVNVYCNLPERNRFFRGLISWLGFRQASLFFPVPERQGGMSKWSVLNLARLAINAVISFSPLPLHFVTAAGVIFFLLAIVGGLHTIAVTFLGRAEAGFPTVILLILITGSVLMISQGILGEYQAKIYDEIKYRPSYLVRDRIESSSLTERDCSHELS